jgi:hypothetical protein
MQYSPKLKIAMDEIKQVLKKHDIAAFLVLHTPGFAEYLNHVNPSYSCAFMDEDPIRGSGIKVKLVTAEVGKENARQLANDTMNMITIFAEMIGKHAMLYIDTEKMLRKKWDVEDLPGEETGHTQQNN